MILICAFITIAILTVVAAITIFLHPTKLAKNLVAVGVVLCIIIGSICGIANLCAKSNVRNLQAEYDDLMLYYVTVVMSENEYIRYDYYDKVNAYNDHYNEVVELSESKWMDWFYATEALNGVSTIDFSLQGDEYVGSNG